MTEQLFTRQLSQMPDGLKQELMAYFEYLMFKYQVKPLLAPRKNGAQKNTRLVPKAGFLKGTFIMADGFDEPLEDFKEYMP